MGCRMGTVMALVAALGFLAEPGAAAPTTPQSAPAALFVVGNTSLSTGDAAVKTRLESLGYTVTVKQDSAAVTGDATGKSLVVISSTVDAPDVGNKFTTVAVPVLTWDPDLLINLSMTINDPQDGDLELGTEAAQTQIKFTPTSGGHYLRADQQEDPLTVANPGQGMNWATPATTATKIATLVGDVNKVVLFAYPAGTGMVPATFVAPARRTMFFLDTTTATNWNWNAAAQALFDAAVRFTADAPLTAPGTPTITPGDAKLTLNWGAVAGATSYTIKRSTVSGGPYTDVGSSATTTFINTNLTNLTDYYYRIVANNAGGSGPASGEATGKPRKGDVLLVVGNLTLGAGDNAVKSRVNGLGYYVIPKTDAASVAGDATGKSFVLISSTGDPTLVGTKFKTVTVPVITWSSALMDDMGMTDVTAGSQGTTGGQNSLSIVSAWHPMAASLTGSPAVTTAADTFAWGVPHASAAKIATLAADPTKATIYCYTTGSSMFGLTAPARRVGFFLGNTTANILNASGGSLFDAAAIWCVTAPPAAPTGLTRTITTGKVTLSWTGVAGVTSYNIRRSTTSGGPYAVVAGGVSLAPYNDTAVVNGTAYYYVVTALGPGGESAVSAQVTGTPVAAPLTVTATPGNGQATLTWAAVAGATGYKVKRSTTNGGPYTTVGTPTTNGFTDTGLTNTTTYYYVVSATNAGGESVNSSQVSAGPGGTLLGTTSATATPGNGQVTVSWNPVAGATSYYVKRLADNGASYTYVGSGITQTMYVDSGLTNGITYFYVVSATNGTEGPNSAQVKATPFGPPSGLVATAGDRNVALSWSPAPGAQAYTVKRGPSGGPYTSIASAVVQTNYTNTGLTNGTAYYYVVTAVSGATESAASNVASATPVGAPAVPTGLAAVAGTSQVSLTWNAVAGATYTVKRSQTSGSGYVAIAPGLTSTAFTNLGLSNGTAYYYVVTAATAGGESANSAQAASTPMAAPVGLTATPLSAQVNLTWSPVAGAASYTVKRSTTSGGPYTPAITGVVTTTASNTGLTNGTAYYYVVSAVNSGGESVNSAQASAMPVTAPAAPVGLVATAGPSKVSLQWTAIAGATYKVKRSTTAGGPYATIAVAPTAAYVNQGLTNGTPYFYVVSAQNGSGEGPNSAQVSATPTMEGPPPTPTWISGAGASPTSITWFVQDLNNADSYVLHDDTHAVKGTIPGGATSYVETGLSENTGYSRHYHSVGPGGTSGPGPSIVAFTRIHEPTLADITLTAQPGPQVFISLTAFPAAGFWTGCQIERSSDLVNWGVVKGLSFGFTHTDTGVLPETTYHYRIFYRDGGGLTTQYSPYKSVTTLANVPAAPVLSATALSTSSIRWSWNNVNAESGYQLHDAAHNVIGTTEKDFLFFDETGLTENTTYTRHVHAVNATGSSNPSTAVARCTLLHNPTTAEFTLTAVTPTRVDIAFGPIPNAANPNTACHIQRSMDSVTWGGVTTVTASPYSDPWVFAGTTYYYRIQYKNGDNAWTATSPYKAVTTPSGAPGAPSNFWANSSGTDWIQWQTGTVNGGTGYQFHDNAHAIIGTTPADVGIFTEYGLAANTAYTRHGHSLFEATASGPTISATAWTRLREPLLTDFTLTAISSTQVTVTVLPPVNSTSGYTGCQIARGSDLAYMPIVFSTTGQYTYTDTVPVPGVKTWYQIRYINGAGTATSWSALKSVTTAPAGPIGTWNLAAWTNRSDAIRWTWADVARETGYELRDGATVKATTIANVTTYWEAGLAENTTYSRSVAVLNALGVAGPTAPVSGTTMVHDPTGNDFTVTQASPTQINIAITPLPNPTAGYTGNYIERSIDRTTWTQARTWSNVYSFSDTTAVSGTQYYYRIWLRNQAGGQSLASPWKSNMAPPADTAVPASPGNFQGAGTSTTTIRWTWSDVPTESSYQLHDAAHNVIATIPQGITWYVETVAGENQPMTRHLHAVNSFGQSTATYALTRHSLVHNPVANDFTVTVVSPTQINVTVVPPANAGSVSTNIWVERSSDGENWYNSFWITHPSTTLSNTGLLSGVKYYYRFRYRSGDVVDGVYSPVKSATTTAAAPVATGSFAGTAQSTSSIWWSWWGVWDERTWELHDASHTLVGTATEEATGILETGLSENTAVTRHVHASNAQGQSGPSTAVTRYTKVHTPTLADFTLTVVSPTQVTVNVAAPPNSTAAYTGCYIERSINRYNWTAVYGFNNTYLHNDLNLIPGTTYYYRIQLRNGDAQPTSYSPMKSATVPMSAPSVPPTFTGTASSPTSITWSWAEVAIEGSYLLHDAAHAPLKTVSFDQPFYVETGLLENTLYTRHVHAANALGTSGPSPSAAKYTKIHEPRSADFSVTLTSNTTARIVVTPPPNITGGLTGCQIERSIDGINWLAVKGPDQNYTFDNTGLGTSVTYLYRIWYRNGDGIWTQYASPIKTVTTPAGLPPAPAAFQASFDTSSSILWRWNATTGATGYVLHDDAHNVIGTMGFAAVQYLETGLQSNTSYSRHVHATNGAGTGPASGTNSKNTLAPQPTINSMSLTPVSGTVMTITVVPPPNGTVGNTRCEVQRYDGGIWISLGQSNLYTRTDTGLTPNTPYSYRVRFWDQSGWNVTAYSPIKTATTLGTSSTGPANFRVAAKSLNSITWAWDATPEAIEYQLRDAAGGIKSTLASGVLSFQETGLQENREYIRQLYFKDAGGALSAPSALLSGSTAIHAATTADFVVQPRSATQIDVIVFSPPGASDGQTGCEIQRSPDGTTWTTLKSFSAVYNASHTGLTGGTTYYYRIRFRNRLGTAAGYSAAQSVATSPPAAPGSFAGVAQTPSSIRWSWTAVTGESGFDLHDATHQLRGATGPGVLTFTENGLAENIQFTRHVHAQNGLGSSPASAAAAAYTLVHDPATSEITLSAVSTTQVNIAVLPPPNGTTGLTGCEIQRSADGGATWTTIKAFSSGYSHSDSGLSAVTTYSYRFRYRNGNGTPTVYSGAKLGITVPQPVLTTPTKKIRNQTIAVAGTVTAGVASVRVYFNGVDKGPATINGTAWSFSAASNPEAVYQIVARAFIGTTPSNDSASISITVDITPPAPPTNIRTTAYNNAIDVEWDPSPSPDVVGYRVYRKTGAGGTWGLLNTTGEVSGTRYRDSTAANGTTYFYRVTAVDDAVPN
jgi:fibronectin type 3 domain-containing protein